MATSGTIGRTIFRTQEVIDDAYRACRVPAQVITSEMLAIALKQLAYMLGALANQGVPLWCQTKYVLPLYRGKYTVPCPVGTVDVLNLNLRDLTHLTGEVSATEGDPLFAFDEDIATICEQTAVGGNVTMEMETAMEVTTVGAMWGATSAMDFIFQWSDDGTTWTTFYESEPEVGATYYQAVDGTWIWVDFEGLGEHTFWRMVSQGDEEEVGPLVLRELFFGNNPSEINMARLNKDDFFYLPNKVQQSRPTQFWQDRQRDITYLNLNPAPNARAQFQQLTMLVHRQIQDVGTLRQEIEVPQRWYEAVVWNLAKRLALFTPEVKRDVIADVKEMAASTLSVAWMEERDNSPIYINSDISPYTR